MQQERPPARWKRGLRSALRILLALLIVVPLAALGLLGYDELQNSTQQSRWLADFARSIVFEVGPGPAAQPLAPDHGPYDIRLGYAQLPQINKRLESSGFVIERQAVPSRRMLELSRAGLFNVYHEKTRAGLRLLDMHEQSMHEARYPRNSYADFDAIPELVVNTLLYIEDRELLDGAHPTRNPVIDWQRLLKAVGQQTMKMLGQNQNVIGGSTLATQLEKFRHSPDGITHDARDKLYQMASASLRVYQPGRMTLPKRRRLLLDYLNSLPLAAQPGYGEISSLGDGLEAWFGSSFAEVNRVLGDADAPTADRGRYYKQVLSLILSVRRPSYYLGRDTAELATLADSHLRRMARDGVIDASLRDAALAAPLQTRARSTTRPMIDFTRQKGANLARTRLLGLLNVRSFYELDRYDATIRATLDAAVQDGVTEFLRALREPQRIAELGLAGARLMRGSDPGKVVYSLTLYERSAGINRLRVNADNLDQPLDINAGVKLDLGSTSKLRTLVSWLELIANAHQQLSGMSPADLQVLTVHPKDRLSAWVADFLRANPGADLQTTLAAAMQRSYSASTAQTFYTGGGAHRFGNFESSDNNKVLSVAEALRRSVNLVFIRVMREVVDHYMYRAPSTTARLLENSADPGRDDYLRRFADREGQVYLRRFYQKYRGKSREQALGILLDGTRASPRAITVALRSVAGDMTAQELAPWISRHVADTVLSSADIDSLFQRYGPDKFNLNDRGYLARVHPLELWLLEYLLKHPDASMSSMVAAGAEARQEVYRWLMKTSRRKAQDRRILDLLEIEAFQELHLHWQKLGYPFASLTPSLATSIGSSGDRPAALAELMGIIVNAGVRQRTQVVDSLHFAADTPYETQYVAQPAAGERVMTAEVAELVRAALIDVVANGTARALQTFIKREDGSRHLAGGKTGTGDHRFEVHGAGGRVIESRVMNRVATFVFLIDDRFYGTITAFVPGAQAAQYEFTSGLPVRLLGEMMPILSPLLDRQRQADETVPTAPLAP